MTKNIILNVGDEELEFEITSNSYNHYINELSPTSKTVPSENFLRRTLVNKEQKERLKVLCDSGLAVEMAGMLIQEFRPEIEISVKK